MEKRKEEIRKKAMAVVDELVELRREKENEEDPLMKKAISLEIARQRRRLKYWNKAAAEA